MTLCDTCKDRACLRTGEPCEAIERQLPRPDRGGEVAAFNERRFQLASALADLRGTAPVRTAGVCALYYRCGWSQEEIAALLGCTRQNVCSLISRAAKRYAESSC